MRGWGRETCLRGGIPARPSPESSCRPDPDSLCHGPELPQPKRLTLGERFGLDRAGVISPSISDERAASPEPDRLRPVSEHRLPEAACLPGDGTNRRMVPPERRLENPQSALGELERLLKIALLAEDRSDAVRG